MDRLHKKCLFASAAMHLLLGLTVFIGAAFVIPSRNQESLPLLDMIPAHLVDAAISGGGGNPEVTEPPAAPQASQSKSQEIFPAPEPLPVQPVAPPAQKKEPEPVKIPEPEPVKPPKNSTREKPPELEPIKDRKATPDPDPESIKRPVTTSKAAEKRAPSDSKKAAPREAKVADASEKRTEKPRVQVNTTAVKRNNNAAIEAAKAKAEAEARAHADAVARAQAARDQRVAALRSGVQNIKGGLSSGTSVEMPGPGGEAYANYGQVIGSIYTKAWIAPETAAEDSSTVRAQVVVSRDGKVVSTKVLSRSGNAALDKSVQAVLNRIRQLPPFPAGATEPERTFFINFNLKSKTHIG
ncbi:MAG: cell envelope integrity protein TolA [Verrucomicrobiota bacterium]|nr:cell envelope integrity protein TolA [Verrucomicrobiota bacterium]